LVCALFVHTQGWVVSKHVGCELRCLVSVRITLALWCTQQLSNLLGPLCCCCCCVAQVLGIAMPKSKKISMSNWECVSLTRSQVKYAALDVLVAGQVFRALRLWHSSPSLCEVCHYNLGAVSTQTVFTCSECDKMHYGIRDYTQHCERAGHKPGWAECEGCGCARQLPWPSSTAAAAAGQAAAETEADHPSSQQSS
jgi:hypothetical protein